MYRLFEKEWEEHVKEKTQKNAKKRERQDTYNSKSMSAFLGNPNTASDAKKENKKRFKKSFQRDQEAAGNFKKPKIIW